MASEAQNAANRRNARGATGTRSAQGKQKSSQNALKWGLSSPHGGVLLPTESREEYDAFRDALLAYYKPVGAGEEEAARIVIEKSWCLRRASKIERGILAHGIADADARHLTELKRKFEITQGDLMKARLADSGLGPSEEVVQITNLELHEAAELAICDALDVKRDDEARLASGFIEDAAGANALAKLGRYQTMHFRQLTQALAMLRELQAARAADTE
jgi:hypothetical protein